MSSLAELPLADLHASLSEAEKAEFVKMAVMARAEEEARRDANRLLCRING